MAFKCGLLVTKKLTKCKESGFLHRLVVQEFVVSKEGFLSTSESNEDGKTKTVMLSRHTRTHLHHPYSKGGRWLQAKIDSENMSCSSFKLWNLNETHVRFGSFLAHVDKSPELTYSLQILAVCRCAKEFYQWLKQMFFIRNRFCLADASQKHLFFWLVYHGCHTSWPKKEDFENFVSHMRRWSRYVGPVVPEQLLIRPADLDPVESKDDPPGNPGWNAEISAEKKLHTPKV